MFPVDRIAAMPGAMFLAASSASPVKVNTQPLSASPHPPQNTPRSDIVRVRGGEVAAMDLLEDAEIQHVHQRCRVSALARRLERLLRIGQCGVGIAEQQQIQRPPGEDRGADLLSEARGKMTMLGGIVERNRAIEVRSRFRDLPGVKQRHAFEAMADHAGPGRALLFRQRQELKTSPRTARPPAMTIA